ncbi:hypothetical protein EI77_00087 [Prosthecobacter fusiformis]|uniref:Uncharacterized protein n=2 Tax=Prosthecobacter fusiformis TaxID=48464 RepID=A0A4R7SNN7_9BACT|nr:hypothetical protein EI77_00087 [Prosthecobacter fusiformis]
MQWMVIHGQDTLETFGLIVSLSLAAVSFRADAKERKISNLMALADSHRSLWMQVTEKPELTRLLKKDLDLKTHPVSAAEQRFVHLLITQLAVSYTAMKAGMLPEMTGLRKDVQSFFSLPIPNHVWIWSSEFQEPEFVMFVEECLREESRAQSPQEPSPQEG